MNTCHIPLLNTLLHFGEGRIDITGGVSGEDCTIPLPQPHRGHKHICSEAWTCSTYICDISEHRGEKTSGCFFQRRKT